MARRKFILQGNTLKAEDLTAPLGTCPAPCYDNDYGDDYPGQMEQMARNIHYPECWDTMAYPTLADAVCEITHCDPKQCTHNALNHRLKKPTNGETNEN